MLTKKSTGKTLLPLDWYDMVGTEREACPLGVAVMTEVNIQENEQYWLQKLKLLFFDGKINLPLTREIIDNKDEKEHN